MTGGGKDKTMEDKKMVGEKDKEDDRKTYKQAFDDFDWNRNGTIPTRVILHNNNCYHLSIFTPKVSNLIVVTVVQSDFMGVTMVVV